MCSPQSLLQGKTHKNYIFLSNNLLEMIASWEGVFWLFMIVFLEENRTYLSSRPHSQTSVFSLNFDTAIVLDYCLLEVFTLMPMQEREH